MPISSTFKAVLPAAIVFLTALPAHALDRRVLIVNETDYTIVEFYGSHVGRKVWEEDILGADVLPSGSSVIINFDDGSSYCMFDFKAVFSDGDIVVSEEKNVCELERFTYN